MIAIIRSPTDILNRCSLTRLATTTTANPLCLVCFATCRAVTRRFRTTVVLVFTWGIAFATTSPAAMLTLPRRTWIFLVLSGLATGLSWLCYFRALQLGEASRVAPVDKLSVVFAIALAVIFLHEQLTWHQWVGGGLVVAGAVVLAWK